MNCEVCGRHGELWPTTPRVICCGRPECRAILTWDAEHWAGAYAMAQSRVRVGEPLTTLDIHARKVHRGLVDVKPVKFPDQRPTKRSKKQEAAAKREAQNPRLL